jgi:hypothetical protein
VKSALNIVIRELNALLDNQIKINKYNMKQKQKITEAE